MRIALTVVVALASACHTVLEHSPINVEGGASRDARASADATVPSLDLPTPRPDAAQPPPDLPVPDRVQPDTLSPDLEPHFSQTSCKNLWTANPVWLLSASGGAAAGRPAIATVGNTQYVVYGEGGAVFLHEVTPLKNLGRVVIGGSSPTMTPTVAVTRGQGSELGVVWETALSPTAACPSALVFTRFDVPYTLTALPPASNLSSPSCTAHGHINPNLVHSGTEYGLATVVSASCSTTHHKPLYHAFTPPSVTASACYNGMPDAYSAVLHALTPSRFAVAHLWRNPAGAAGTLPLMISLRRGTNFTSLGLWEGITEPSTGSNILPVGSTLPGALTDHRPALASLSDAVNDTLYLAWMASDEKLRTHSCAWPKAGNPSACTGPAAAYPAGTPTIKYRHPALAASQAHDALLVMAYATSTPALGIVRLREGLTVLSSAEHTITRPAQPRFTALAAHPEGFGLTWLEPVGGVDEVFYTFIGCQP